LRLDHRMAGAQLRLLQSKLGRVAQRLAYQVRAMADDDERSLPGQLARDVNNVRHHRLAAHAVQHFG